MDYEDADEEFERDIPKFHCSWCGLNIPLKGDGSIPGVYSHKAYFHINCYNEFTTEEFEKASEAKKKRASGE